MYRCPPVGEGAVAVLNGCETAVRDLRAADEAMGLMSAFLLRGASLVLATQWRVLDACAAEMAIKFVTEWASGARPADALRSAQRLLRQMTTEEILARYDQALRLFPSADCPHESAALHREAALLSRLSGRNAEAKAHAVHAAQAFRRAGRSEEADRMVAATRHLAPLAGSELSSGYDHPIFWGAFQLIGRSI